MNTPIEQKRIAFVTGASRGIGRVAAVALAKAGHHVILSARIRGGLEETDDMIKAVGGSASILPLDLLTGDKVDALGPTLYERFQRVDVLVACGGVLGRLSPVAHIPNDIWEHTLAINLTANLQLIRTLDPLLRRSDAGRAVFVTANAAHDIQAYWGAYAATKAALNALVQTYAAEMATTPVRVNLLDPGATRTKMRAQAYPGEDASTVKPPEVLAPYVLELVSPECTRNGEIVVVA